MSEHKPKVNNLQNGILACPNCEEKFQLSGYSPLEIATCASCKTPLFIPLKLKHYWLYRPLGGGGMGSVYQAISMEESGEFAVKMLPQKRRDDQELIKTLMREGEIGTILGKSPHIIEVVDYGSEDGEHYMVSRLVEGTRLDVFISSASMLSERQALDIMSQVLDAEIHIKNCGYLFRDMKPENIMIIEATATVKICDFGLCMSLEQAAHPDSEDHIEGSPFYLPPERIVAAPEGEYSEIYSLGMLFFHMLAGETYFSKADIKDLVTKHVRSLRVASVKTRLKQCSPQIVEILDKMIQPSPNDRYHTLSEVAVALDNISKNATGYPLLSSQDQPEEVAFEEQQRYSSTASRLHLVAVAVLVLLMAGGVWYYWQKIQKERKLKELIAKAATELNISPEIEAPTMTKEEIAQLIDEETITEVKAKQAELSPFNKKLVISKICKEYSIKPDQIAAHYRSIESIKKRIKTERNAAIEKKLKSLDLTFNDVAVEKEILQSMKRERFEKPTKTVTEIKKEALAETTIMSDKKLPIKLLSKVNIAIFKKYKCYKKGDIVMVPSRSGEKIEGVYQGINGRTIKVNNHYILLADLPVSTSIKFNQEMASTKISTEMKRAKAEFVVKKRKYKKSVYNSVLVRLLKENGYVKSGKEWISVQKQIERELQQRKDAFEEKKLAEEERIIKSIKKNFDDVVYYQQTGYLKLNGKWHTGKEVIDEELITKQNQFNLERDRQLQELKNDIKNRTEERLYRENGYIYYEGQWVPAKQHLDDLIKKKIGRMR